MANFGANFALTEFHENLRDRNSEVWSGDTELSGIPLDLGEFEISNLVDSPRSRQCNTNIFEYSNILHRILDIRIRILNFLVANTFDIRIRPGYKE